MEHRDPSGPPYDKSAHPHGADAKYSSSITNNSTKRLLAADDIAKCDVQMRGSEILSWVKGVVTQFQPILPCNCTKLINSDEKEISSVQQSLEKWHENPAQGLESFWLQLC